MKYFSRVSSLFLMALLSIVLSACGGDDDSSGGNVAPVDTLANSIIEGQAVKGPVKYGLVTVYALDATGNKGKVLASTTTDVSGYYSCDISSYSGAVLVEVSTGTFIDEATGVVIDLTESTTKLRTLIPTLNQGVVANNVVITPLTSIATELALSNVQQNKQELTLAFTTASTIVGEIFGVNDIVGTMPVFDTAGLTSTTVPANTTAIAYGKALSDLSTLSNSVFTNSAGSNVMDLTAAFVLDATDGVINGKQQVNNQVVPVILNNGSKAGSGMSFTTVIDRVRIQSMDTGYCVVSLLTDGNLVKSHPAFVARYDRETYYFSGINQKRLFDLNPEKFIPALSGDSVVAWVNDGQRLQGNASFSSVYNGQLFYFQSVAEKQLFDGNEITYVSKIIGADGYCTVSLLDGVLVKGSQDIYQTFDGIRYHFTSEANKTIFTSNPDKYVPVLDGICSVNLLDSNNRVQGYPQYRSVKQGRLYFFNSQMQKDSFDKNPKKYSDSQLANNGNCLVSKVFYGKSAVGSKGHRTIYKGREYRFVSDYLLYMFNVNPMDYLSFNGLAK